MGRDSSCNSPTSPNRKPKHLLTHIPEDERPISHRFTFALVAKDAKPFVDKVLSSEMAEAHSPCSSAKLAGQESNGQESVTSPTSGDDRYVLYLPGSLASRDLVRIRFKLCINFSDNLPLVKDKASAMNSAIIFLFWKGPEWTKESTTETISDWRSRMAELIHHPSNFRPQVVVVALNADDDERTLLMEFVQQQTMVKVTCQFFDEDDDDARMESMQHVQEVVLRAQAQRNSRFSIARMSARSRSSAKKLSKKGGEALDEKACCVIA